MISSNTSVYKLKSSKNYNKDEIDYSDNESADNHEFRPYKGSGSSRAPRTRSTEFRSSRSSTSGRSTFRGRRGGEAPPRRGDYGDAYYTNRKYENNRNESSSGYRGKFYEPEKKLDIKLNLPEDTRISKLLRRLNIEINQEASLQISKKLLEVLMLPDNAAYVRKAFHILGESMYDILLVSPGLSAKQQAARALGRMGYIMGQEGDFDRYQNWLFEKLSSSYEEMQTLLVSSLRETLFMDSQKPVLEDHVDTLINSLVTVLEVTENVEVFKSILEVLVETVTLYECFAQFRDTIDLLFGWHVDHTQSLQLVEYISGKMQQLAKYFKLNLDFSIGLIENFLEDLHTYEQELEHVIVLILAMNTVVKCLGDDLSADLVLRCLKSVIKAVKGNLDQNVENLIIAGNDCVAQLLGHLDAKYSSVSALVYDLIKKELGFCNYLPDCALVSTLLLIARVIKELSTNLPSDLIETLIGPQSVLIQLRNSKYCIIKDAVLCVYQSLVNLKNVSLLQEVYKYLLSDLDGHYTQLLSNDNGELIVLFLLRCLSQLANGSSIIVMWALKPSILDLVGVKLGPQNAAKYPHVQYCLIQLLFSHCKCYNHFITNSNLVSKTDFNRFALTEDSLSCNGGNFGVILEVLHRCLTSTVSGECVLILLQWLKDILVHSDTYLEAFYLNSKFVLVVEVLVKTGYSFDSAIALAVGDNLEKLLSNKQLAWPNSFLTKVCDLCKLHMCAIDEALRNCYSTLIGLIPWDVSVGELNRYSIEQESEEFNHYTVKMAQTLHLSGSFSCDLKPQQFKTLMEFLLNGNDCNLRNIFIISWLQDCSSPINTELFYDLALNSREVLSKWATLEAAQFCISHKLRTPLGKPNETFTKIETALNHLGNMKSSNITRVRMLLQFVDHLEIYQNWLFEKLSSSYEEMQTLLVSSLRETLFMDAQKPVLEDHVDTFINSLVTVLEVTENVEVFKSILEVLVETVTLYESFAQFRDTIDLLFGWHVDHTQSLQLVEYISGKMQQLAKYFKLNLDFSIGLIENFLEDLHTYEQELEHVIVLILAMNTVVKCLGDDLSADLVLRCLKSVIKAVEGNLDQNVENLIIAGNDCIAQLLGHLDSKYSSVSALVYDLIKKELGFCNYLPDCALVSTLLLIARVIKELSTNLPSDLIETLIGPQSVLIQLRNSKYCIIKDAVLCVYQSLVNLKNVSLLQEVYKYLLSDLDGHYTQLLSNDNGELIVLFLLRCLSQLANGSSIIVMWALKPSILDLVGVKLGPQNAAKYPHVQYCLIQLLFSHCKCYNHFITNSNLVSKTDFNRFALTEDSLSCNGGNFGVILEVLHRCLTSTVSGECVLILLQWLKDILVHSDTYLEAFYLNSKFVLVVEVLVKTGYSFDSAIALAVGDNLEKLLSNKQLAWPNSFLTKICDLCKLHMCAIDEALRNCYSTLISLIPWDVSVGELNRYSIEQESEEFNHYTVKMAQTLHLSGSFSCDLKPQQFKTLMEFLLNGNDCNLRNIFIISWLQDCSSPINTELFYDLALNSREVLSKWATLEAAQFCISHKLRTPLGKPNETFTKIETALNHLGNMKSSNITRVRMLLQFVDHLEKCIYNASEGCAVAMRQPSKGVKQFFIANINTCNEWLSRLRLVMMDVAVHCGEAATVLKHGHSLLKDLNPNTQEFDKVLVFIAKALVSLQEPEALIGLFTYAKIRNRKLLWLKCASDQASRRFEIALDGYKKVVDDIPEVSDFIQNQIINCYKELQDYSSILEFEQSNDYNCIHYLSALEQNNLEQLGSWELLDENASWNVYDNLNSIQSNLYNYLSSNQFDIKTQKSIQNNLQILLPLAPSEFVQTYSILQYVAKGPSKEVFLVSENFNTDQIDTSVLSQVLWWSEQFNGQGLFSSNLRLDIIKRSRKEKNLTLASNQLSKFFQHKNINLNCIKLIDLNQIADKFPCDLCTLDTSKALVELIKLTYEQNDNKTLALNLCALVSTIISKYSELYSSIEHKNISSKLLLKLANWMQLIDINFTELHSPLGKLLMVLPELNSTFDIIPLQEMAVGKLLQFSAHQCQTLAKSWNAFGTWCYKWGRKIVDDKTNIQLILPQNQNLDQIYAILNQDATIDVIKAQLHSLIQDDVIIEELIKIWQQKLYYYYSLSADAYFKYLHLSDTNCNTTTITLRLLRLTVKYALELQTILEQGLQTTPTKPWKSIIPQLFSRLNHPESYVRHRVSDLLCRVAQDAPHLITFPAVVGALEGGLKFDFTEIRLPDENNDDDDYESDCEEDKNSLQTCFETMVETLAKQDSETISQVRTLVKELRRIALLWDELWLNTLAQHQTEITRRQQQLEYEIEKLNDNPNLSQTQKSNLILEKQRIIIKPIIFVLEQLRNITSVEPQTPHEQQFQTKYLAQIDSIVAKLKHESLAPMKQLQKIFQQKFHKLKMSDISPALHSLKNTLISMPGLASKSNVTIARVGEVVTILPTKTKPKKLVFYGSDGQTYTYLFKVSFFIYLFLCISAVI